MTETVAATADASADAGQPPADEHKPPRSDLKDAIGWTVFGTAALIGSIRMDRLEKQDVNPYTVPGLLPGLLGIAMILLGLVLGVRSWRRGAGHTPLPPTSAEQWEQRRRVGIVVALCLGYGVVLVGHGIPFWLASTVYVTASILILRRLSRDPAERQQLGLKGCIQALVIGLSASVITHLSFQELFLVRMP